MKKLLPLLLFGITSSLLGQQQFSDPGFENWSQQSITFPPVSYDDLDDWNTLNGATGALGSFTATKATGADAYSGSSALRLETLTVFGQTANGIATNGTIDTNPPYGISGGITWTSSVPDSLVGYYKAAPASGDFPTMEVVILDATPDTLAHGKYNGAAQSSYTRFAVAINSMMAGTPANAIALFSSSNGFNAVAGSVLHIDDVELVYNPVGIQNYASKNLEIYPNPVAEMLFVKNISSTNVQLVVSDISGRQVLNKPLSNTQNSIDVTHLKAGLYTYNLVENNALIKAGKLVVNPY